MKKIFKYSPIVVIFALLNACQQNQSSSVQSSSADPSKVVKVDTATMIKVEPEKIVFYDPIVLEVADDQSIKLLGKVFTTEAGTPSLNNMIKDYLNTCYGSYRVLPKKIDIHYSSSKIKLIGQKGIELAIVTALESVRNHVPGTTSEQMARFPILYQTKF